MELTEQRAIDICKELWTWLAETGKLKFEWSGWEKYGEMKNACPLCEYSTPKKGGFMNCPRCPYFHRFGSCCYMDGNPYSHWDEALTTTTRKKYARLFLKQLNQSGELSNGKCYFCGKEVSDEFYCYGCEHYVCSVCDEVGVDIPWGGHDVNDHEVDDESVAGQ